MGEDRWGRVDGGRGVMEEEANPHGWDVSLQLYCDEFAWNHPKLIFAVSIENISCKLTLY